MARYTVCGLKDTIMENVYSSENISICYKTEVLFRSLREQIDLLINDA